MLVAYYEIIIILR